MLERFKFNCQKLLIGMEKPPGKSRVLLALSGGVDSCVMAHLFHRAGYDCVVAHCNFQLRGPESDADENFVKTLALHYGFEFHVKHFHTAEYASDNGVSIQMAARHLRYQWFNELIKKHHFQAVAVAHHANDVAETMLLNLVRGAGIAGMHGISEVNGKIIRPLLFASGTEISAYAATNKLTWREDASNAEDHYSRNKIRLNVLPVLAEINPSVIDSMVKHARLMSSYEKLLHAFIRSAEAGIVHSSFGGVVHTINMAGLLSYPEPEVLLYHFLNRYGFNGDVCNEILSTVRPGAVFQVPGYKIVSGRGEIFLLNTDELKPDEECTIHENEPITELRFGSVEMVKIPGNAKPEIGENDEIGYKHMAYLDGDKLSFPLTLRRWKAGDYFYPLGMHGKKLVSDYFTDEKFTPAQKELVYLLLSGGEVAWIAGHRIDDRFKLTDSTTTTRKFTWKQAN